jgi:hypothetical protein
MSRNLFFIALILIAQLSCFDATKSESTLKQHQQAEESESEEDELQEHEPNIDESMRKLQQSTTDSEAEFIMEVEKNGGIKKS